MEPSLDLQAAILSALRADVALTALVGSQIYDQLPLKARPPYLVIGDAQIIGDYADCIDGSEISLQIDAWGGQTTLGYSDVKTIAHAVRLILHDFAPNLSGNRLISFNFENTRFLRDPDGITRHAALTFSALTEPF